MRPGGILLKASPPTVPACQSPVWSAVIGVENFATRSRGVTRGFEKFRQGWFASDLNTASPILLIAKDAAAAWQHPRQHGGPGGIAERVVAVRIGKTHPHFCQPIHVRGVRLWMASQPTGPIAQIIGNNEENIGLRWQTFARCLQTTHCSDAGNDEGGDSDGQARGNEGHEGTQ